MSWSRDNEEAASVDKAVEKREIEKALSASLNEQRADEHVANMRRFDQLKRITDLSVQLLINRDMTPKQAVDMAAEWEALTAPFRKEAMSCGESIRV